MSELTRCNYCTFQDIKRRNKGKRVGVRRNEYGWLAVLVNGEPTGVSFLELTDRCAC